VILSKLSKKHIVLGHVAFWLVILFVNFSFDIFYPTEYSRSYFYWKIVSNTFFIFSFYIAYALIVPIFTRNGRLFIKLLEFVIVYFAFISFYIVYIKYINEQVYEREVRVFYRYFLNAAYYSALYMFMGAFFRLAINGLQVIYQKSKLEKQNLRGELALLRSQINPHFLFNTLNNIHAFTHKDADKTAFSIIKLSEIMRYMLNESESERVLLEDEIAYVKSYIALQNIRFSETEYVFLEIEGDPAGINIAPMIFVPFVENAFKHGDKRQKDSGVKVSLRISKTDIIFEVCNLKRKIKSEEIEEKSGFGLENLRRRLELTYPDSFILDIQDKQNEYITKLKIDLSNEN
jgi:two-component system, LytTR family, sensor kinase